jgi:glycosyltransferase involved in cell wall biosynthesis
MNRCHALLLFSYFEGMPVVALEALACGLPVFASEVGQLPYIIQEGFGKLVKPNHTHEFSEQLALFMQNQLIINSKSMLEFIEQHASYKAVGSQMAKHYLQNFNAG